MLLQDTKNHTLAQITQRKPRHFDTMHRFGSSNQGTGSIRHRRYFSSYKEVFSTTRDNFPPPPTRRFLQQQLYSRNYKLFIQKDFSAVYTGRLLNNLLNSLYRTIFPKAKNFQRLQQSITIPYKRSRRR